MHVFPLFIGWGVDYLLVYTPSIPSIRTPSYYYETHNQHDKDIRNTTHLHTCGQVDKTREQTAATKAQASKVQVQAREVTNVARGAAQASERQQAAFLAAKKKAEEAQKAGEEAKAAFRCGFFVAWWGVVG